MNVYLYCLQVLFMYNSIVINIICCFIKKIVKCHLQCIVIHLNIDIFWSLFLLYIKEYWNGLVLTYIICSHHDIAEILQKLELNTNQSIHFIWMPSNNLYIIFSMFYGLCLTPTFAVFQLYHGVNKLCK
jgi:hypothetical protein